MSMMPVDAPKLDCPKGLVPVWVDKAAGTGECTVVLPSAEAAKTGLQMPFPAMQRPPGSLNTPARIELGKLLFFDPILSGDDSVSCAHCHHPKHGFTDNRAVSTGIRGQRGGRSAPTVWNAAFSKDQFWDGRAHLLEDQAKGPIQNPIEMDQDPVKLLDELRAIPEYVDRFDKAFGGGAAAINLDNIAAAIATFERSVLSVRSAYDRYAAGDTTALSASALRGFNLFRSVGTRCFECHGPPTFANPDYKVIGVPMRGDTTMLDPDRGRAVIVAGQLNERAFKVPTLRNVEKTAPYMHNGVFQTLEEVLDFYAKGGGPGHMLPVGNVDDKIRKFDLSTEERSDLVAFLKALTDESLLPDIPARVPSGRPVAQDLSP